MNPFVIAMATARLTQLLTEDQLTAPVRKAITNWAAGAEEFTFKDRVAVLTSCTACMSVWSAAGILIASTNRWTRPLVRTLAASGVALLLDGTRRRLDQ